jgi:hypothetical protein
MHEHTAQSFEQLLTVLAIQGSEDSVQVGVLKAVLEHGTHEVQV